MFGLRLLRGRAAPTGPRADAPTDAESAPPADAQALLRRIEWTVLRRLDGLLQGDYRTLIRGFGLDLADLREYQIGDDVRHIDWNATARLQTTHVRQFIEDRQVDAWFLVDLSGSIDFGSTRMKKLEVARELVATLARVLTRHGNRVGAVLYRQAADEVIPARNGRRQVLHLLDRMARPPRDNASSARTRPDVGHETSLDQLLGHAEQLLSRRSIVFLVSDFLSLPGWERPLARMARRHEVVAVRVHDALETSLPDLGLVVMQDAESGEQLFVDTRDRGFRRRFEERAAEREEVLRSALGRAGVDCLELMSEESIDGALLRFCELRKRRTQLAAGVSLRGRRG